MSWHINMCPSPDMGSALDTDRGCTMNAYRPYITMVALLILLTGLLLTSPPMLSLTAVGGREGEVVPTNAAPARDDLLSEAPRPIVLPLAGGIAAIGALCWQRRRRADKQVHHGHRVAGT